MYAIFIELIDLNDINRILSIFFLAYVVRLQFLIYEFFEI